VGSHRITDNHDAGEENVEFSLVTIKFSLVNILAI